MERKIVAFVTCLLLAVLFGPLCLFGSIVTQKIESFQQQPNGQQKKKKVMIFMCNGGYGHRAACAAVSPLLENEYELQIVNPFTDILSTLDFAKKLTGKDCDEVYNALLRYGWIRLMNFYCLTIVPLNILGLEKKMQRLFTHYFIQHQPDMIISLIPVVNLPASNAAANFSLPYMMVTLDHDTKLWQVGLNRSKHKDIIVTVHNKKVGDAFSRGARKVSPGHIIPAGFPVRPEFTLNKDLEDAKRSSIKESWQLPHDRKIVMVMMGGVGGKKTIDYVRQLSRNKEKLHVIVCAGSNETLMKSLEPIVKKSKTVTFSLIPFTTKIAELLAVSDLIITKPGPGTIEEALSLKVPLLLDRTSALLFWERENVTFAVGRSFAREIRRYSDTNKLVSFMLEKHNYEKAKRALDRYESPFNKRFIELVHQLCPVATSV